MLNSNQNKWSSARLDIQAVNLQKLQTFLNSESVSRKEEMEDKKLHKLHGPHRVPL